jgi:23S rRNA pseudouridine2605 synthase
MSEGLLLLTNDGDFAEKIIHPKYKLEKVYKVKIKGKISDANIDQLRTGIILNGKKTKPAIVFVNSVKNNTTTLKITIFEGRKRQIRYMLKSVGSEVLELKRLQIGNVKLNKLPLGMWRMLKPSEVTSLLQTSRINTKRK